MSFEKYGDENENEEGEDGLHKIMRRKERKRLVLLLKLIGWFSLVDMKKCLNYLKLKIWVVLL